jgi:hypothetical protein
MQTNPDLKIYYTSAIKKGRRDCGDEQQHKNNGTKGGKDIDNIL